MLTRLATFWAGCIVSFTLGEWLREVHCIRHLHLPVLNVIDHWRHKYATTQCHYYFSNADLRHHED